jgi:hypothetical protein
MDFYEAFAHTWGSTGTVDESLTTTQYDQGWNFIGARPPRLGEFNKREKLIDQRLKWLYDQLKTAADAHGVTLAGADVGGLLAILQDLIGDHTSAVDPHAQYQLESGMSAYATLANPALTGTPTAPTAAAGTNTTQIATTEFVQMATGGLLTDPAITGCIKEDVYTITDGAAFEIDPGNGSVQLITLGALRTPKATNFAAGESVTLMVLDGSAYTLTWTDASFGGTGVVWVGGTAPTLDTTKYTVVQLWKVGGQVYGALVGAA